MIIFGTRVRRETIGVKPFYCPTCHTDGACTHEEAKRWFTLFFIPIFPMDKVGEMVTCHACGTQYHPDVLAKFAEKRKNDDKPKRHEPPLED